MSCGDIIPHSGFAAVAGRPNVGKSTLVNRMVGEKVAITSPRPQTTRNRIAGIVNRPEGQLVLLDLPGFQKPRDLLTERMQQAVETTLAEVDMILMVTSAVEPVGAGDRLVASASFDSGTPVFIAVNKTDIAEEAQLLPALQQAAALGDSRELFPVSALRGDRVGELVSAMMAALAPGPRYFPEDAVTDQPERMLVAELIREQAIRLTREEVPHAVAVDVTAMDEREGGGIIDIAAAVIVERESQKGIMVGRRGRMIREIGTRARKEIEKLLGSRVYLELVVRVKKRWRDDSRRLDDLGL